MNEYLKYLQERIDKDAEFLMVRNAPHGSSTWIWTSFVTAEKLFDAAEALVKPESLEALHVQRERLIVDGALLYLWPWLDRRLAADAEMPFDHETVIRRYETNWRAQFKAFFSEKAQAVREARIAAIGRAVPGPETARAIPETAAPRCGRFQLAHVLALLPGRQDFVADAEAAGGMAAAFVGRQRRRSQEAADVRGDGRGDGHPQTGRSPAGWKVSCLQDRPDQREEGDDGLGPCERNEWA